LQEQGGKQDARARAAREATGAAPAVAVGGEGRPAAASGGGGGRSTVWVKWRAATTVTTTAPEVISLALYFFSYI
jgi:hypothetical protein